MVFFRGQKKLGPRPDRSPLGVKFKISDEHPQPFHMQSPPGAFNGRLYRDTDASSRKVTRTPRNMSLGCLWLSTFFFKNCTICEQR